jgi:preprotein translocase subunit SecD
MLLQAEPLAVGQGVSGVSGEQVEKARALIEERLRGTGAQPAVVRVEGAGRIRIEIPGSDALDELRAVVAAHAELEVVDGDTEPPAVGSYIVTDLAGPSAERSGAPEEGPAKVWHTVLTAGDVDPAGVALLPGPTQSPDIRITFTGDGSRKLAEFTEANLGKFVPFVLDKQVVSVPIIRDPLTGGVAAITTQTPSQALGLFVQLKYGPLPVSLKELEATVVPAPPGKGRPG